MRQFTLNLNKKYQRPIVELKSWHGVEAMLDTGAVFPVWTGEESILRDLKGRLYKENVSFSGFGGVSHGNLYILPSIMIGVLEFKDMPIIASKDLEDVPFQMLLSATMFSDLIYEIDDKHHKLYVKIPDGEDNERRLKVRDSHGRLHILCNDDSNDQWPTCMEV